MSRWVLDAAARPLLVLHLDEPDSSTPPDFESLFGALAELRAITDHERALLVVDLAGARPDAKRRMRLVSWLREEGRGINARVDALAIVAPSAVLRGVITAVGWFFPERMAGSETFQTRAEALAWARGRRR